MKNEQMVELNELDLPLEDLNLDMDLNLDIGDDFEGSDEESNTLDEDLLKLSMILEDGKYLEDSFDGKYYMSYLGLNPLTVFKEQEETIRTLLYANYDKDKIAFLVKDLRTFIDGMKFKEREFRDEYVKLKEEGLDQASIADATRKLANVSELISKMVQKTDSIEDVINVLAYDISLINPRRKESMSIVDIIRNDTIQEEIMTYAISDFKENSSRQDLIEKDKKDRMNNYSKLMESINTFIGTKGDLETEEMLDKGGKVRKKEEGKSITTYKNTTYTYSEEERKLLAELRFPMVLAGRENLIKDNINEDYNAKTTLASIDLRDWHKQRIYRMYNLYDSLSREIKVSDFYGKS